MGQNYEINEEDLDTLAKTYWEMWLDEPHEKLDFLSPRQAATIPKGRARLEELLQELEAINAPESPFKPDFPALRKALGLN